jgi:hypothetical protein
VISTIVIRENQVQAACARKIALESLLINVSRDLIFETMFSPGNEKKNATNTSGNKIIVGP